ncbi:MAG: RnfABCDGE type electron transport complex subunit D [Phycisphaerae bacterium]|nr:RnfABCDGE type electron transport complex subunit D [Phycisphaerae bacterium]
MKWLLDILKSLRPNFEEGGRLKPMKPLFDAAENFFFAPSTRTGNFPHVRDPLDVKRFMSVVIIAILPCFVASVYFFGLRIVPMIIVSYAVGGAVEVLFAVVRKEEINEGFLVTGFIFPLILPPGLPLWMVAVGVAFGVLVGKELFGGTGRNLFNPALVGRCLLAIGYPAAMSANWIAPGDGLLGRITQYADATTADAISQATPLVLAKQGTLTSLSSLFWGNVSGSVGETSAILIILGGLFLLFTRVANWRTVVGILGSFAILAGILHNIQPERFVSVPWHLCAGGLLFGAFFMATDPVTSPITNAGKWAYGIIIGVSTVLIRNLTGYVEGVMFAILLGNIAAPILDEVALRGRLWRLKNEE